MRWDLEGLKGMMPSNCLRNWLACLVQYLTQKDIHCLLVLSVPRLQVSAPCSPAPSSLSLERRQPPATFKSSGWSLRTPEQEEGVSVPKS